MMFLGSSVCFIPNIEYVFGFSVFNFLIFSIVELLLT